MNPLTDTTVSDGTVVLLAVVGSTAYGLAHEGSDEDHLGVYQAPTTAILGLHGASVMDTSHVRHEPDVALHEIGKYTRLALKANPTVLELLWASHYYVTSEVGEELIALRREFLATGPVRAAYAGYAVQQAHRLRERSEEGREGFKSRLRSRTAKHGRHCYRLLTMGRQLLATGELTLDVSDIRERIFEVGELAASDPHAFAALFERELADFDATPSVLPEHPNVDAVEEFLVRARLRDLATRS